MELDTEFNYVYKAAWQIMLYIHGNRLHFKLLTPLKLQCYYVRTVKINANI